MNNQSDPSPAPLTPAVTGAPTTLQKIELTAGEVLNVIDAVVPYLEKSVGVIGAAAGPIGAGLSAATVLLKLLSRIPTGPEFTVQQQADIAAKIAPGVVLDFSAPEWQTPLV